jgi:hypothetical protein
LRAAREKSVVVVRASRKEGGSGKKGAMLSEIEIRHRAKHSQEDVGRKGKPPSGDRASSAWKGAASEREAAYRIPYSLTLRR